MIFQKNENINISEFDDDINIINNNGSDFVKLINLFEEININEEDNYNIING